MNNNESVIQNEIPLSPEGIPTEFAEIPEGYDPAYIVVRDESIDFVAKNGFSPKFNNWDKNPIRKEAEDVMDEVANELGILENRKCCVYTQSAPEKEEGWVLHGDSKYVIEVLIDPKYAKVADAGIFEYVVGEVRHDTKRAKKYALDYWGDSVSLEDFNKNPDKYKKWKPEILYFKDIPLKHTRLVHSPKID